MLKFQTYPQANKSDITSHSEVMISDEGDYAYPIIITKIKLLCTAAISLILNDAIINVVTQNFSESLNIMQLCILVKI